MNIEWYVVLSSLLFAIGAMGILIRRSPIVILLCLELMLNAGNLALVAFSRMVGNQQGQVFAIVVMVVAACEVVVGLGLIVAIFRRKLPLDVDELRELQGMSATSWAWLVLLFPLLGSIVIGLGFRALPARAAGAIGTAAIALAFVCGVATLICLLGEDPEARHHASSLWDYANAAGLDIKLGIFVDPLSVFMVLVVTGVSTLIHLYSFGYMQSDEGYRRFFSYLNFFVFSMLLLVLAGNFVLLIVGWAFVGFASYALISFWYRRTTATRAGMKAFVINVVGDIGLVLAAFLIFRELGTFEYERSLRQGAGSVQHQRVDGDRDLPAAAARRLRQVGAAAAPHLAAGRDGGPDPGLGPDPRGDDGDRRRLPDRPHPRPLRPRPDRRRHRRLHRPGDAAGRRHDRDRP